MIRIVISFLCLSLIFGCSQKKPSDVYYKGHKKYDKSYYSERLARKPSTATPTAVKKSLKHTIKEGETLYRVSKIYNVSVDQLMKDNNITDISKISIGTVLTINTTMLETSVPPTAASQPEIKVVPVKTNVRLSWPIHGDIITKFGRNGDVFNNGISISGKKGDNVQAAADGEVVHIGKLSGYGNLVIIKHDDNLLTAYGYLDSVKIKERASVKRGDIIATVGQSGNATSPQLYFSVKLGKKVIDPLPLLQD